MHLQGQKQRRTTDAATMQEKEILAVQAKKCIPTPTTSHNHMKEKTGAKPGKKPTPGPTRGGSEVQKRSLGGGASVNQPRWAQAASDFQPFHVTIGWFTVKMLCFSCGSVLVLHRKRSAPWSWRTFRCWARLLHGASWNGCKRTPKAAVVEAGLAGLHERWDLELDGDVEWCRWDLGHVGNLIHAKNGDICDLGMATIYIYIHTIYTIDGSSQES